MKRLIILFSLLSLLLCSCGENDKFELTVLPQNTETTSSSETTSAESTDESIFDIRYLNAEVTEDYKTKTYFAVISNVCISFYNDETRSRLVCTLNYPEPFDDLRFIENSISFSDVNGDGHWDVAFTTKEDYTDSFVFIWDKDLEEFIFNEATVNPDIYDGMLPEI